MVQVHSMIPTNGNGRLRLSEITVVMHKSLANEESEHKTCLIACYDVILYLQASSV